MHFTWKVGRRCNFNDFKSQCWGRGFSSLFPLPALQAQGLSSIPGTPPKKVSANSVLAIFIESSKMAKRNQDQKLIARVGDESGRVLAWHAQGPGFDPHLPKK